MSQKASKSTKKRLIIVLISVLVALLLMYTLTLLIPLIEPDNSGVTEEATADFIFYEPDYSLNIFEDEDYMAKIANGIFVYDDGFSATTVDKTNANDYGAPVKLIVDALYSVIEGERDEYNGYFSKKYFESNDPKDRFTMQKIYNGSIEYYSEDSVSDKDGTYTSYTFKVKYYIDENNGTYRKDIGDGAKTQYITISDREGKLLIDSVVTAVYK